MAAISATNEGYAGDALGIPPHTARVVGKFLIAWKASRAPAASNVFEITTENLELPSAAARGE
jgi:hypothetical protein